MRVNNKKSSIPKSIEKCPTGIVGFDKITLGGLPKNRSTLVCGGAGSGKSMFGMEFLIRGAVDYKDPGLFVAFEETDEELTQNIASLGYDVQNLISRKLLVLDHIQIDRTEFTETGSYSMDGLFIRLTNTIDTYKIKRVVLDTLEVLFGNLKNEAILRSELQRLFRWFKSRNITVIVTAEQGANSFSRYGLEEYVADCVIFLDNRVDQQISTRRLRIAKYRGSSHGNNEYPFIISENGIAITAITSTQLDYKISDKRISSGIKQLDTMLGGSGFYRGSSILISGPAGIGKSSFAAAFANETCERGERCLYFAFEESVDQILRNMKSIGLDLNQWMKKGLIQFHAIIPNSTGLAAHLAEIRKLTNDFNPSAVIIDPITSLRTVGHLDEIQDITAFFKRKTITTLFTSLISGDGTMESTKIDESISSLIDTSIYLHNIFGEGERNRGITLLKSRGMAHSNQLREVIISNTGIHLQDVYIGQDKVLAGSARLVQASKLEIENSNRESELKHKERELEIIRKTLEAEITALYARLDNAKEEAVHLDQQKEHIYNLITKSRADISKMRMADSTLPNRSRQGGKYEKSKKKARKT